jgi:hypothetical protein
MVRYAPVPSTGTVYYGTGTVWENPTCRLPVLNPKGIALAHFENSLVELDLLHLPAWGNNYKEFTLE